MSSLKDLYKIPGDSVFLSILVRAESMDDRTASLVFSSHVDFWLEEAIVATKMQAATKEVRQSLFGDTRPLAALAAKEKLACALGIIGPKAAKDLKILREIRNVFAHSGQDISFETQEIAAQCDLIDAPNRYVGLNIIDVLRAQQGEIYHRRVYEVSCYGICCSLEALSKGIAPPAEFAKMID